MKLIIPLFIFFSLFFIINNQVLAQGAVWDNTCISANDPTVPTIQGFECLFENILKIIVTIMGFAFLAMFIMGGFQYMMSNNDPKAVAGASTTLTYAVIGIVGAIISWLILWSIQNFTGINVTVFKIPF